jgi:hypothetical protein
MTQDESKPITVAVAMAVLAEAKSRGENRKDFQLKVRVLSPGAIGGSPCVSVTSMHLGIDWNDGRVLIDTDKPLTILSPEDVAAIHKSAKDGQSWHAYQQYKKQGDTIQSQQATIEQLKQDITDAKQASSG